MEKQCKALHSLHCAPKLSCCPYFKSSASWRRKLKHPIPLWLPGNHYPQDQTKRVGATHRRANAINPLSVGGWRCTGGRAW